MPGIIPPPAWAAIRPTAAALLICVGCTLAAWFSAPESVARELFRWAAHIATGFGVGWALGVMQWKKRRDR